MKRKPITPARQAAIERLSELYAIAAAKAADQKLSYDKYIAQLSSVTGVDPSNIRRTLAGKTTPTLPVLLRICEAMKVRIIFAQESESS